VALKKASKSDNPEIARRTLHLLQEYSPKGFWTAPRIGVFFDANKNGIAPVAKDVQKWSRAAAKKILGIIHGLERPYAKGFVAGQKGMIFIVVAPKGFGPYHLETLLSYPEIGKVIPLSAPTSDKEREEMTQIVSLKRACTTSPR
jgi:hypothetical protein